MPLFKRHSAFDLFHSFATRLSYQFTTRLDNTDIERMRVLLLTHLKAGAQKKIVCGPKKEIRIA